MKPFLIISLIFSFAVSAAQLPESSQVSDRADEIGVAREKTAQDELVLTKENKNLIKNVPKKQKQEDKKLDYGIPYKDLDYKRKE